MKIVCISDTHCLHSGLELPEGDVLVHAGDMLNSGLYVHEIEQYVNWLNKQTHKFYKIIQIAGNHDFLFEKNSKKWRTFLTEEVHNLVYLEDEEYVFDGIKFYGSPYQPEFFNWAFNKKRGKELEEVWKKIPDDVNVLVTHSPPYGVLDKTRRNNENVGCKDLSNRIEDLLQLKLHVFGHIHESYGVEHKNDVVHVNASSCTDKYVCSNKPIVINF